MDSLTMLITPLPKLRFQHWTDERFTEQSFVSTGQFRIPTKKIPQVCSNFFFSPKDHYHLFVGDLSPELDDRALYEAFSAFGSVSDARIMKDLTANRSRGYGFVAFRTEPVCFSFLLRTDGSCFFPRCRRVQEASWVLPHMRWSEMTCDRVSWNWFEG